MLRIGILELRAEFEFEVVAGFIFGIFVSFIFQAQRAKVVDAIVRRDIPVNEKALSFFRQKAEIIATFTIVITHAEAGGDAIFLHEHATQGGGEGDGFEAIFVAAALVFALFLAGFEIEHGGAAGIQDLFHVCSETLGYHVRIITAFAALAVDYVQAGI